MKATTPTDHSPEVQAFRRKLISLNEHTIPRFDRIRKRLDSSFPPPEEKDEDDDEDET